MSRLGFAAIAAVLLSACSSQPLVRQATTAPVVPTSTATVVAPAVPPETPMSMPSRVVLRSSSLSLTVEDPAGVLADLESLIEEAGGFITSASSWGGAEASGYASLSARVPPDSLPNLRREIVAMAPQIQSQSSYSQDVTAEYGALLERLQDVREAEARLQQFAPTADEPGFVRSVMLLSELLRQERRSVETQIQSYNDRAELASLDITLNQLAVQLLSFEGGTPTPLHDG